MLIFAYSSFVRTLVWLAYRYLITLLLVKTPAYDRIYLSLDWKSASLTRKVEQKVTGMKLLAKKNKRQRIWQNLQRELDAERKKEEQEEEDDMERMKKEPGENGHTPVNASMQQGNGDIPGPPPQREASATTMATPAIECTHPQRDTANPDLLTADRHPCAASSTSNRRSSLHSPTSPRMISEGAQTTPSLLEQGYNIELSTLGGDDSQQ